MKRALGIDYGTQRIGVALSFGTLAEPFGIVDNNDLKFEVLARLCREHNVSELVVGISEQKMAEKTKVFVKELQAHTHLPVSYVDETLSTKEVRTLLHLRKNKTQTRRHVDHLVAARLLQEWIDAQ